MNKTFVILICIFLTIIITYQVCKTSNISLNKEQFSNNFKQINSFEEIDLLKNKLEVMPNNSFIILDNPSDSKVLVQDGKDMDKTYYKFTTDVKPNYNYKLRSWYANINNWDGKDKLFNIKMYDKNNKIHPLSSNGTVISEKNINGIDWKLTEYNFKIPNNFRTYIDIFLGYKPDNTKGKRYLSELKLKEYVLNLIDFPNIDKLILYLDASLKESYNFHSSYNKSWTNKINKINFNWEKIPEWSNEGFFKLFNRKLIGTTPSKLNMSNREFSIIIISSSLGRIEDKNNPVALKIRGNQNIAISINIPNDNSNITIDFGDKKYLVPQQIIASNKNMYTVSYNNDELKLYVDETLIKTFKGVPKIYFDDTNIEVNPYRDWNANLYSILIFNKELSLTEVKFLNSYFKRNIIDNQKFENTNKIENFDNYESGNINDSNDFISDFDSKMNNFHCPNVVKKDNKYSFDVTNSDWAKSAGVSGHKFYDNKEKCMKDYSSMYKNCEIPKILREPKKSANNCIFTGIHTNDPKEHPCQLCPELDNYDYSKDIKVSEKCKNSIKSYCYNQLLQDDIDKNCICFTDDYSKTPDCQNFLLELHDNHLDYSSIKN